MAKKYTWSNRLVAVISDGTAVLGLGDIGPAASLPVMEGKSALFKTFGGLDSIPIVLDTKDPPDEIVETIIRLRPTFGAVNLEDISAPRCFEIERRLIEALDCPVMHDDQHGTAIVVLAALMGATKHLDRDMHSLKVVMSGAGAAGVACTNILLAAGITDITVLDSQGILQTGRTDMNSVKADLAARTNPRGLTGGIAEALNGADAFMGGLGGPGARGVDRDDDAGRHRVRDVQPGSGDPPGRGPQARRGRGHRAQRLPEPDQQRSGLPPVCSGGCAGRRRTAHHRENESRSG